MIALLACAPYTISLPGAPEPPAESVAPIATLKPSDVSFSGLWTTDGNFIADQTITIQNMGRETLDILGYAMDDETGTFSVSAPGQTSLLPGDATTLVVSFTPTDFDVREAMLKVATTDPNQFESIALVQGNALGPEVSLKLENCDTRNIPVGCSGSCTLRISNHGTAGLRIDGLQLEGTSLSLSSTLGIGAAQLPLGSSDIPALPWYIEAGDTLPLQLAFTPTEATQTTGRVHMQTNAPLQPELQELLDLQSPGPDLRTETHLINDGQVDILVVPRVFEGSQGTVLEDATSRFMAALPDLLDILESAHADWRMSIQVSDDGCISVDPSRIPTWVDSRTNREHALRTLSDQLNLATPGTLSTSGFFRVEQALRPAALGAGGCNEGLHRPGSSLALVSISDTAESSGLTWQDHVNVIEQLAGTDLTVHAFVGEVPVSCGGVMPGLGWIEAASGTGGMFWSICEDTATGVVALGEALVARRAEVSLEGSPIASTLSVTVDGLPRESGWMYDHTQNRILFQDGQEPVFGSTVVVGYEAEPVCELGSR